LKSENYWQHLFRMAKNFLCFFFCFKKDKNFSVNMIRIEWWMVWGSEKFLMAVVEVVSCLFELIWLNLYFCLLVDSFC
jgi:hypothetical protein